MELCHLKLGHISLSRKTLQVHKGKGNKDRLISVGERAIHWLSRYLTQSRDQLILDTQQDSFFLNDYGEPFRDTKLGDKVKRYVTTQRIIQVRM